MSGNVVHHKGVECVGNACGAGPPKMTGGAYAKSIIVLVHCSESLRGFLSPVSHFQEIDAAKPSNRRPTKDAPSFVLR